MTSPDRPDPDRIDPERLDQIGERIDKARSQAVDAGVLIDPDEERYDDSGANPSADDQTITPPG